MTGMSVSGRAVCTASAAAALLLLAACGGSSGSEPEARATTSATSSAVPATAPKTTAPKTTAPKTTPATTTAAPKTSASTESVADLKTGLVNLLGTGDSFSAVALDMTNGRSVQIGATSGMKLASLVKLSFLETMLYQDQQKGVAPGSGHQSDLQAMIEQSDNNAAQRIWYAVGDNAGVQVWNNLVGLKATVLDPTGTWGLSTSSAADQLTLLQQLVLPTSPLNAASRAYALNLMNSVEADQKWGVSGGADAGASTANKNGWLNIDSDNGLWAINSAGITTVDKHQVLMVIMSQHQPSFGVGVARVSAAAKQLAATVS